MTSLILIPSYLWKNTFNRWFENPISPLSKILVPALLGLLSTLVLVFFAEVESQLLKKLKESNSYEVYITEQLAALDNRTTAKLTFEEEAMWLDKYGHDQVKYIRQPHLTVEWRNHRKAIPVIIYGDSFPELQENRKDIESPTPAIWLLTKKPASLLAKEEINLGNRKLAAIPRQLPERLHELIKSDYIVALPSETAEVFLRDGFSVHIHAKMNSLDEVASFVGESRAYYHAQKRSMRIFTALEILQGLEKINKVQNAVRLAIVISCGIILALILGTIAWLEYRQEAYLLALLRSFGSPRSLLLFHALLENVILISLGTFVAFKSWKPIYALLQTRVEGVELSPADALSLPSTDANIILLSAIAGAAFAMIPIACGLRKPTGLILQ